MTNQNCRLKGTAEREALDAEARPSVPKRSTTSWSNN